MAENANFLSSLTLNSAQSNERTLSSRMLSSRMLSYQHQKGFHLPVALVVISLVLLVSTKFHRSIVATQQEAVAEQQQLTGLRAAEVALKEGEDKILGTTDKPFVLYTVLDETMATTHLEKNSVWNDTLVNYKLDHDVELLTGNPLTWIDQPLKWWEKYTVSLDDDIQGYYAIEYVSEDKFGNDLGQSKDYKASKSRLFFKVTARGVGQKLSTTVLQSHFSKVY